MEAAGNFFLELYKTLGPLGGTVALLGLLTVALVVYKFTPFFGIIGNRIGIKSTAVEVVGELSPIDILIKDHEITKSKVNTLQCLTLSGLEVLAYGAMLLDKDGEVVWVNNRLAIEMCKTGKPNFYGQNWTSLIHSDDRERVRREVGLSISNMSDIRDMHFQMTANGHYDTFVMNSWITKEDPMNPEVNNLEATGWIAHLHLRDSPPMTNHALGLKFDNSVQAIMDKLDQNNTDSGTKH
jgi:hypothetical protein